MIVEVVFPIALPHSFDYQCSENLARDKNLVGFRVIAPWRNSYKEGVIVSHKTQSSLKNLKTIHSLCDNFSVVSKEFIGFSKWVSQYYFSSWGEIVFLAIPRSARIKTNKQKKPIFSNPLEKKTTQEVYFFLGDQNKIFKTNSYKQKLLEFFRKKKKATKEQILLELPSTKRAILDLVQLKILEKRRKKIETAHEFIDYIQRYPKLNQAQQQIVRQCKIEKKFRVYLLYGVNASGKTEIYITLIRQALQQKKSVLFLVPEIALTPQTKKRIQAYFPQQILLWHSSLTPTQKLDIWLKIKTADTYILLGTRSALFQPIKNLGLIVIDEEHDTSFRQIENPVYNARDCACKLAQLENIPLLLGSATPSIESYRNAKLGKYTLLSLKQKYQNKNQLQVKIVNLKTAPKYNGIYYFSQELQEQIAQNLDKKEQTMIFLNRRGYAPLVSCKSCKKQQDCQRCSVPLTWHNAEKKLLCHYCLWESKENFVCTNCNFRQFVLLGIGIEKIEKLLGSIFPQARILRLDSDSLNNTKKLQKYLELIENFEVDIIIGTQIITKGHHFPRVTLGAVLLADAGFQRIDYKATEKTFQLLSQFIGRAGRQAKVGKTIVQSLNPKSNLIQYCVQQNFIDFYQYEIEKRSNLQHPPMSHWVMLKISAKVESRAQFLAKKIFTFLEKKQLPKIELLGPIATTPYKLDNWFRLQIILQSQRITYLQKALQKEPLTHFIKNKRIEKIKIIVDP